MLMPSSRHRRLPLRLVYPPPPSPLAYLLIFRSQFGPLFFASSPLSLSSPFFSPVAFYPTMAEWTGWRFFFESFVWILAAAGGSGWGYFNGWKNPDRRADSGGSADRKKGNPFGLLWLASFFPRFLFQVVSCWFQLLPRYVFNEPLRVFDRHSFGSCRAVSTNRI